MPERELIRVLLVDDDEDDYLLTRDVIKEISHHHYTLDWVSSFDEALGLIGEKRHDVYLIDFRLGARTGLELIREANQNNCSAPLILLTGQGDLETDVLAMRAGAADYLVKGNINSNQLERAIRYSLRHARDLEEIRKLNTELGQRVDLRTGELEKAVKKLEVTNKSLRHAQIEITKALNKEKELNELKSRFVTIASHEFRTPLSTILSSVSLISKYSEQEDEEKRHKHVSRIKTSVNNLKGILDDFLSLSKLEEGRIYNNPVEFDPIEFSEEVAEEMRSVAKTDQQIRCNFKKNREKICLDKQVLKNVVINLLSNAIKYSPEGKPIDFSFEANIDILKIEIKDQGIGIPDEDQQHLFDRFFRANNAGNIQGTGLGLHIVKKYVDLLGGTISYESKVNLGTTFLISIPLNSLKV
jgi:signal transduction histidine kinase